MKCTTGQLWVGLMVLTATHAFFLDGTHDETLQQALTAIDQLNTRLQAAETALAANVEKLSRAETEIASLQSRAFADLQRPNFKENFQYYLSLLLCIWLTSDFVWYGDWVLAFRGTRGIGKAVYDTWTAIGRHDDDPVTRISLPCGCTTINGSLPCDRHYRSRLLDTWPSSSIEQVRLVVYNNGVEKAHVTFRGTGSDYMSWFTLARVLDSSWTDLTAAVSANQFSIQGDATSSITRRFFINSVYNGCQGDIGWFVAIDRQNEGCAWGSRSHFPAFLYSPHSTMVLDTGLVDGDVMAVFVKFRQSETIGEICMK